MSQMQHDNVIITAVTAGVQRWPVVFGALGFGAVVALAAAFHAEINTVLNWVVGGVAVTAAARFLWLIRDDIPRPGERGKVAAFSGEVDAALKVKHAALADAEAALADDEPEVPDELAARRMEREAS